MGTELQFGKRRTFRRGMVGMVVQQCECAQCHQTGHLKMVKMKKKKVVKMVNFMLALFYHNLKNCHNNKVCGERKLGNAITVSTRAVAALVLLLFLLK